MKSTKHNIILIILLTFPFFTVFITEDIIGSSAYYLIEKNITKEYEIGILYISYTTLSPLISIISGIILDKFGYKKIAIFILLSMLTGSIIIYLSILYHELLIEINLLLYLLITGRILCGFGEALINVQNSLMGRKFKGKWINLSFAISNIVGQIGNIILFWVTPIISEISISIPYLINSIIIVLSIIIYIIYICYDQFDIKEYIELKDVVEESSLSFTFWLLCFINMLSTVSFFVTISFAPIILTYEYNYNAQSAGFLVSMMNLLVIISPIIGYITDVFNHRGYIWFFSCLTMSIGYFILPMKLIDPLYILLIQAYCFTIINSTVNASVSLVVKKDNIGKAYGIIGFLFTLCLLIYQIVISILQAYYNFDFSNIFFYLLSILNMISAVCSILIILLKKVNKI